MDARLKKLLVNVEALGTAADEAESMEVGGCYRLKGCELMQTSRGSTIIWDATCGQSQRLRLDDIDINHMLLWWYVI